MRFVNPNFRGKEKKLNNEIKKVKEELLSLDEILKNGNRINNQIELIDYPHNAKITNVPRTITVNINQLGTLNVKYSNMIDNNIKNVM